MGCLKLSFLFLFIMNVVRRQCENSSRCSSPSVITEPGNVYIIALYSNIEKVNEPELELNILRLHLRLRYFMAVQHRRGENNIGFVAHNICNNVTTLSEIISSIYLDETFIKSGQNNTDQCKCSNESTNVIAVISFMPESLTRVAANLMELEDIPYFAYTRHEDTILRYTDFRNFYSVHELIRNEVVDRINDIRISKFKTIVLLSFSSRQDYTTALHQAQLLKQLLKTKKYCVQSRTINGSSKTQINNEINYIKKNPAVELIIIWTDAEARETLVTTIDEFKIYNRTWLYYTSENLDISATFNASRETLKNMFLVYHPLHAYKKLHAYMRYNFIKKRTRPYTTKIYNDIWVKKLLSIYNIDPSEKGAFGILDVRNTYEEEYVENIFLVLWKSQPYYYLKKKTITEFRKFIHQLAQRELFSLESFKLNKQLTHFNFTSPPYHQTENCQLISCVPGYQANPVDLSKDIWNTDYQWFCEKCEPLFYRTKHGYGKCIKCQHQLYVSNENRTRCYDPYVNLYLGYGNTKVLSISTFFIFAVVLNVIALLTFIVKRKSPIVRSSNFKSSIIQLISHLLLYISVPVFFVGESAIIKCISQSVVTGFLMTIITAVTLQRTQQLLFALQARKLLSREKILMSEAVELALVVFLVIVQIIFSCLYILSNPPSLYRKLDYDLTTLEVTCHDRLSLDIQLFYMYILYVFCAVQGIRARKLPKGFNETKYIAYSMSISTLLLTIKFPLYNSVTSIQEKMFVSLTVILLINTVQLCLMYTNKVFTILFRPHLNTRVAFRKKIRFFNQIEMSFESINSSAHL